jgi:hypothetical protein
MSSLSDDERRERKRLRAKEYYAENKKKHNDCSKSNYLKNVEQNRERSRQYRVDNKEVIASKDKIRSLKCRQEDPEYNAKARARAARNKDIPERVARTKKVSAAWAVNNPDSKRASVNKRRAVTHGSYAEKYSTHDVLDMYGTCCHLCGEEVDLLAPRRVGAEGWQLGLHIDHVIQIAHGGPDTLENVRPAHGLCNLRRPRS